MKNIKGRQTSVGEDAPNLADTWCTTAGGYPGVPLPGGWNGEENVWAEICREAVIKM